MTYKFFYGGVYSNWFGMKYSAPIIDFTNGFNVTTDIVEFDTSEQYMMFHKALLFKDFVQLNNIMTTREPSEQKQFGRDVKNFNKNAWDDVSRDVMYIGIYHKFLHNDYMKNTIMSETADLFVEASPYDEIWGIKLGMKTPQKILNNPDNWKGLNWLGEVITRVRDDMVFGIYDINKKW